MPSQELNSRPLDYKSDALSTELLGHTSEMAQYNKKKTKLDFINAWADSANAWSLM